MGIAKARRIAQRAHRGQLDGDGELFLDRLERLVGAGGERGGGWVARQAAWLHAVPATGVDLKRLDLPWRVVRVVEACPGWSRHEFLLVHRKGERVPPWIARGSAGTPDHPPRR